ATGPALTATEGLILAVKTPASSLAVMLRVAALLNFSLATRRASEVKVIFPAVAPLSSLATAFVSELVMVILVVAAVTMFQLASTALTIMPLLMVERAV